MIGKETGKVPSGTCVCDKAGDHAFPTPLAPGATSRMGRILCSRWVFFSISTEELHPPLIFFNSQVPNSVSLQFSYWGPTSWTPIPSRRGALQLCISPTDSRKSPSRTPSLGPRRPGSGRGSPAAGAAVRPAGPAEPSHSRGRRGGRRPLPPGLGARGGAACGRERHPSSRTSRRFLTERGGGESEGHGVAPPLPRVLLLFAESGAARVAAWAAAAHSSLSGRGEPRAVCAPATLRPPGARLLPVRVRVCRAAAASWGQQRKAGRGERGSFGAPWPRRQRPLAAPAVET